MRKLLIAAMCLSAIALIAHDSFARNTSQSQPLRYSETPGPADLPPDLMALVQGPSLSAAAADTTHLAWYGFGTGSGDAQGWTSIDITAQLGTFFHVADGTELNGGQFGKLLALEGSQSMWCGAVPNPAPPFCGYATLPGYGNSWSQQLVSKEFDACDSVDICYRICWDSEPGYDQTFVQWRDVGSSTWNNFPVNGGVGYYDGTGVADECMSVATGSTGTQLRFSFISDGAWSDEDGLWPTDGAVTVDSITVTWYNEVPPGSNNWVVSNVYYEDFEGEAPGAQVTDDGCWTATTPAGFGDFAAIYAGVTVVQEDPCFTNLGFLWGFFDDPNITNYACGGFPLQGAMRFGPDANGLYMNNGLESPKIPYVGAGDQVMLSFLVYRDLPLDNLQFYNWAVRSWVANCPGGYSNDTFVFFGKDWGRLLFNIGSHIDAGATDLQIQLGAVDACAFWCLIFGTGNCHSHAPLFDEVHLQRVNVIGPQFSVRHLDLFQDTFASDGTTTGHGRADAANDIAPSASPTILPGDSISVTASNVGTDPFTGIGPRAYVYVAVWPQGQPGKTPANIEAPETRAGVGKRFPLVDTVVHDGVTWACFRMDSVITTAGAAVSDRYCVDLNDWVFTPCDTICYVIAAEDASGNAQYFSRTLNGQGVNFIADNLWTALDSPMEFQILPGGGWKRGGDILYVDDVDDRGGPAQLFFDTSLDLLGLLYLTDRYDVMGPSSNVANSLASRVTNINTQIVACYRKIIWCSGNLSSGLIGDGTGNPEKSDDFALLFAFLDTSPNQPGLYISGDDIAQEWATLAGAGAINLQSIYMNYTLIDGDHVNAGEAISPTLTAIGPCFVHPPSPPEQLIAYGGCALINDFDVLQPTGLATSEFPYPNGSGHAIISQATPNSAASTARVILSGFAYNYIRDPNLGWPPQRVEHLRDIMIWLQNIVQLPDAIPDVASRAFLDNAAPNPFNPETTIRYGVRERGHVTLRVYNVAGQLVRTLVNDVRTPSPVGFEVTWDGRNDGGNSVSSGVYFYKLTTSDFVQTKKMVLLK